ncbi:hypothetical protein [uncultured Fibrobacter sp.]|uniref:nuclease-related domain-containing DEAD/DEAH box helicase n=1 Tax=uncultured Fibrobacter sp. TaxID=261512 RepID=UPI0025DE7BE4|nr:hypothetical protein [uncultured Fibrobacter sp.]
MTVRADVTPDNPSRAEVDFSRIANLLDDNWLVWMDRSWYFDIDSTGSVLREVDAVLYHRKHGLLLVECKSGKISARSQTQTGNVVWMQSGKSMAKPPHTQVASLIAPLHEHMKKLLKAPLNKEFYRVRVQWAVCFSDMENMEGIPLSEIPRKRALLKPDMQDVNKFEERLIEILQTPEESHGGNPYPNEYLDEDAFFALRNFFDGIGDIQTAADTLREDNYYSEQATEMQQMMMESISRNNRVRIEGVAGSGKSRMVIWEALRLSKIGKSVAIACYNDLLAEELREDVENALAKERKIVTDKYGRDGGVGFGKIEVNVYADWCKKYAKAVKELPKMGADKSQYYDKELPHAFSNAQVKLFKDKKLREKMFFDAVIIDEAQDFASEWIDTLIGLLRDKERGFARVFYDPAQRLYANRDGIENVQVKAMPVMVLKRGFRNTKKILEWIYKNTNIRLQSYNNTPQGTSVKEYRYKDVSEEEQLLINSYNELERKYSVKPSEVLVVSMRSEARSGIKNIKDDRFVWNKVGGKKLIQDKVNIVSAYRIKGLDTMAVILVDVEEPTETSKREDWKRLLLVGATRAKKLLTVIRKKA